MWHRGCYLVHLCKKEPQHYSMHASVGDELISMIHDNGDNAYMQCSGRGQPTNALDSKPCNVITAAINHIYSH